MSPDIQKILNIGEARFFGVDSPRLSAEVLVAHVLKCSRLGLTLDRERVPTESELAEIERLFARREAGEPIAYILGEKEFYGLDFRVTPDVLIPRPETEHIVEEVESLFAKDSAFRFADLGTGSGILAVTICTLFEQASATAVDISPAAIEVARSNAKRHGVDGQIVFQLGDFTDQLFDPEQFDLVVSNPPYVTEEEFADASHEVTEFEPTGALVSGVDGLNHIRAMLPHVARSLNPGGYLLMEIGFGQGEGVKKIIREHSAQFGEVRVISDLAGLDRVVFARKL